jgi:uncharacterized membrane protein
MGVAYKTRVRPLATQQHAICYLVFNHEAHEDREGRRSGRDEGCDVLPVPSPSLFEFFVRFMVLFDWFRRHISLTPEWLKLIGVLIVFIGLALRLRTTLVVLVAAFVTGLLAGLPFVTILNLLGKAFADNRLMTLFLLTLPAIGLAERYGLQHEAAALIRRISAATVGRLLIVYQLFRIVIGALGIRLNGHPSFVRPLVLPMALGAKKTELTETQTETIKAATAASENYGNFYGQNLSVVQAGVLLVYGVMKGLGYEVSLWRLVAWTSPIVLASVVWAAVQFAWLDRRLKAEAQA